MRKNKKYFFKYDIIVFILIIEIRTIQIYERFWESSRNLKMWTKKAKDMAKRIYHCYIILFNFDRKRTVRHFFLEGISTQTTSRILDRYEERGITEPKKNIGRPVAENKKTMIQEVKKAYKSTPNISESICFKRSNKILFLYYTVRCKSIGSPNTNNKLLSTDF